MKLSELMTKLGIDLRNMSDEQLNALVKELRQERLSGISAKKPKSKQPSTDELIKRLQEAANDNKSPQN